MARFSGRLVRRTSLTASAANGNLAVLGVWRPGAAAGRSGQPTRIGFSLNISVETVREHS
jgi:hypothetical protein